MENKPNVVVEFLANKQALNYRGDVEPINTELAVALIDLLGGVDKFNESIPTARSFGIEAVFDDHRDEDLLAFFYLKSESLLHEMSLIGQSVSSENKTAMDYILNNTDGEYTEDEIEQAIEDGTEGAAVNDDVSTDVCKWIVFQATSELCANYEEFQEKTEPVNQ